MSQLAARQPFSKLEALGNDFVVLDFRAGGEDPPADQVRMLADRHTGIGFDQLLILHPATASGADCRVQIHNADGSPARQCGNGMRAVALWLHQSRPDQHRFVLETDSGPVSALVESEQVITVSMGQPDFDPVATGLQTGADLEALTQNAPGRLALGTVNIGNPHLVLLLDRPAAADLVERLGGDPGLTRAFAEGVNVSFAHIEAPDRVALRVHERGAGATRACGSAACATAAWLLQQGLVQPPVRIQQPGGPLVINWRGLGHPLHMTGPARRVFDGRLP